jgi:hypothetical protein
MVGYIYFININGAKHGAKHMAKGCRLNKSIMKQKLGVHRIGQHHHNSWWREVANSSRRIDFDRGREVMQQEKGMPQPGWGGGVGGRFVSGNNYHTNIA